jgi:subtilisin-like proprotein convertase family protein
MDAPSAGAPQYPSGKTPAGAPAERLDADLPQEIPQTFSSGNIAVAIADNATTTSTIFVDDSAGLVADVNVRVRLNHTFDGDLLLALTAPNGATVMLSSALGGVADGYGSGANDCSGTFAAFDDEVSMPIELTAAPFAGTFRPMRPLSGLDGSRVFGTWRLQVVDQTALDVGTLFCWQITVRRTSSRKDLNVPVPSVSVWRPSSGAWFTTATPYTTSSFNVLGQPGDIPVNSTYLNGFGTGDRAVFRPSTGQWFIAGLAPISFGTTGDVPVPADYTGDGVSEVAVWRPSDGRWYFRNLGTIQWGVSGDIPVTADYNADGFSDVAVWRPSTGTWYVKDQFAIIWGAPGDIPVPADYFGDDRVELAIFRPSDGVWYIRGLDGEMRTIQFGVNGDIPVPADYDGDGRADIAVWRPSDGRWYIRNRPTIAFGTTGDIPITKRPSYAGYPF